MKTYEIERGVQIPLVNVSDMKLFRNLLAAIKNNEKENKET